MYDSGKMLVLAAIYGAMNILSFVAFQGIGAGEFTVCAQLKILTTGDIIFNFIFHLFLISIIYIVAFYFSFCFTAGFSVLILGTSLSMTKWRALGNNFL